jgi:peroxin-11B
MSHSKMNLDEIVRFTGRTTGRDKIYRTIQYASRLLAWYYIREGSVQTTKRSVELFQNLESLMSLTRKGRRELDEVHR